MNCKLSPEERETLLQRHRSEHAQKTADRIKAILLSDDGWSNRAIARVLFLDEETIARHIKDYVNSAKL